MVGLVWCRRCSGLGPKLMNRCRPNKKGKKEQLNAIFKPEKGEVLDRSGEGWKVEGERRRVTR